MFSIHTRSNQHNIGWQKNTPTTGAFHLDMKSGTWSHQSAASLQSNYRIYRKLSVWGPFERCVRSEENHHWYEVEQVCSYGGVITMTHLGRIHMRTRIDTILIREILWSFVRPECWLWSTNWMAHTNFRAMWDAVSVREHCFSHYVRCI